MFSGNMPVTGKCHEIIFQAYDDVSTKEIQALSSPTISPLGSSPAYTNSVILILRVLVWRTMYIIVGITPLHFSSLCLFERL